MKTYQLCFLVLVLVAVSAMGGRKNPCSTVCTMDYRPVCAGDGATTPRTFPNACSLASFNCKSSKHPLRVLYDGACGTRRPSY